MIFPPDMGLRSHLKLPAVPKAGFPLGSNTLQGMFCLAAVLRSAGKAQTNEWKVLKKLLITLERIYYSDGALYIRQPMNCKKRMFG